VLIAAVGAAFALSFDTLSQAVLFSLTGSNLAGWLFATALGLVFTLGMMKTDALNGLWVASLLARADARAAAASRVMSIAIAVLALAIAAMGAARSLVPALHTALDDWSLALGVAVVATVAAAYILALRLTLRAAPQTP